MPRSPDSTEKLLFSGEFWSSIEQAVEAHMKYEIQNIDSNRLLNTSLEDLVDYFSAKEAVELPVLGRDIEADSAEVQIDVSRDPNRYFSMPGPHHVAGTRVTITVPFTGDADLLEVRPMNWGTSPPRAIVGDQCIVLKVEGTNLQQDHIQAAVVSLTNAINQNLGWLSPSVSAWNTRASVVAREAISNRRDRLLQAQNLVESLGFKVKPRAGESLTYAAPQIRRKVMPAMPKAGPGPYQPEPILPTEQYEHVLSVMQDMALVMERSPSAFQAMGEESLRIHFLVGLNGHYEGQATGETFNGAGKTDILIRVDGKNIFIAECKFWGGPKVLVELSTSF